MKYGPYIFTFKLVFAFAVCVCMLSSCMSADKLTASGSKKLSNADPSKAEKAFAKAIAKDPLYAPAILGLAKVAFAKGDIDGAIAKTEQGLKLSPTSYDAHFHLVKWYCMKGDSGLAMQHLLALYPDSSYHERVRQSDTIQALDLIRGKAAFRRWHSGIRRLRIQPLDGFSNETDKGTENDQFVTVVSEGRVVLATVTIQDKNQAYWKSDQVIIDSYVDSAIMVTQMDEDYVFCDVLSSGTIDPKATGEVLIRATNSHLRLMVSDTDEPVYTSGTALPTTPSLSTTLLSIKATRVLSNPDELDKSNLLK